MLGLIFFGILIYIIALIVKYNKLKANAFSKEEVRKAAQEQAKKIKYKEPVISCDYCGCAVDTRKNKVCPHCGAPYDKDDEWSARFNVSEQFIEKSTEKVISQRERKAEIESKKVLKKLKKTIFILVGTLTGILVLGLAISIADTHSRYRKNEELNDKPYYEFVPADYAACGDGVIYDDGKVKVTVNGFYYTEDGSEIVKVGLLVENTLDKAIKLSLSCNSINGIATSNDYIYMYDSFKKKSTTQIYEDMYYITDSLITEMVFNDIAVRSEDYNYRKIMSQPVTISTSADTKRLSNPTDEEINASTLVYSNEQADIYAYTKEDDKDGFYLYIKNKSESGLYLEKVDLNIDGEITSSYGLYKDYLPSNYLYVSRLIHSDDSTIEDLTGKKVFFTLSVSCKENPSYDFSTEYLDISDLFKQ